MDQTTTQKMRGRPVTHAEAEASGRRLINSHFHNPDSARIQIPVSAADDDVIISDYIWEQSQLTPIQPDTFHFVEPGKPCGYWSNGAHIAVVDGMCRCGKRFILAEAGAEQAHRGLEEFARAAAREICAVFDVSVPRGVSLANSREQTIAIIIEQNMRGIVRGEGGR